MGILTIKGIFLINSHFRMLKVYVPVQQAERSLRMTREISGPRYFTGPGFLIFRNDKNI
jgi:hypothetical protein